MKKTIATLLLVVYIFNLAGYQAFFDFLQQKASSRIIEQLDNGSYQKTDLVEVKIPYPLPYAANWPNYERFDGEVDLNGMHYNYVERKMSNDTLYLLCIPNHEKGTIAAAKNNYFININEITNTSQGKKSQSSSNALQKSFSTEYNDLIQDYSVSSPVIPYKNVYGSAQFMLLSCCMPSPFQPPKV